MNLPHLHARCTFTGPELIFICILIDALVHLFQFVTVPAVPDPVSDGIKFKVHCFLNLYALPHGRLDIKPAPDPSFDILIQFLCHLFYVYRHI